MKVRLMTDRERTKLLFGPYRSPPLKPGDRTTCLYCDSTVIVTSWTSAPIGELAVQGR